MVPANVGGKHLVTRLLNQTIRIRNIVSYDGSDVEGRALTTTADIVVRGHVQLATFDTQNFRPVGRGYGHTRGPEASETVAMATVPLGTNINMASNVFVTGSRGADGEWEVLAIETVKLHLRVRLRRRSV